MPDIMTLPEYAKGLEHSNLAKPLIMAFAESSDIMDVLPFEGLGSGSGGTYEYFEATEIPDSIGFRAINEPSTSGEGVLSPFQEASYIIDHDLDVDAAIVKRHGMERRAKQERLTMAGVAVKFTDTFLGGNNQTDPREFDGIQTRALSERLLHNSAASGGAALSLSNLDAAIENTYKPTHLIFPFSLGTRTMAAARTPSVSGNIFQTWDEIGKPKLTYAGLPILRGYPRNRNTGILPFDDVASGGGSAVTSSIYVVSIGEEGLRGIQLSPMAFDDLGLLEDHITYRTHFNWDVGLVAEHPFCITRLDSITNAAFVA